MKMKNKMAKKHCFQDQVDICCLVYLLWGNLCCGESQVQVWFKSLLVSIHSVACWRSTQYIDSKTGLRQNRFSLNVTEANYNLIIWLSVNQSLFITFRAETIWKAYNIGTPILSPFYTVAYVDILSRESCPAWPPEPLQPILNVWHFYPCSENNRIASMTLVTQETVGQYFTLR